MGERDHDNDPSLARAKLIELLEDDDKYLFLRGVLDQGRVALHKHSGKTPSEFMIVDYFLDLLRSGFPILRTPLGEPPGSGGVGWVMNNPDGNNTYIKLKIAEDGVFDIVWVMSCHTSKHERK